MDPQLAKQAADIFFVAKPTAKHIEQIKAVQDGRMPPRPNVDCPAYAKDKATFWPRVEEALQAKDIAALEAVAADIRPRRTSRKIIRTYALLAAIAIKAKCG